MTKRAVYVIISFLLSIFNAIGQINGDTIVIDNPLELKLIGSKVYFLEDKSAALSISDILRPENQSEFIKQSSDVFTANPSSSAYWFKFTVSNKTNEELWLEAGGTYSAWIVDFYQPDSLGNYSEPITQKAFGEMGYNRYQSGFHWFKLDKCSKKSAHTFYVRIESGVAPELPFYVGTRRALDIKGDKISFIAFFFLGVMSIMFLYNLFLFFTTLDKIYLSYVFFVFMNALCFSFNNNFPFFESAPLWWEKHIAWQFFGDLSSTVFILHFLNLRKNLPVAFKIYLGLIIADLLVALLNMFGIETYELVGIYSVISLLLVANTVFTGVYLLIKKQHNALFFAISWSFLLISFVVFILVTNGVLPYNTFTRYSVYFGLGIEALLFSIALADRLRILRKEKDAVLNENITLIQNQNQMLEKEVQKKTRDLDYKNKKLQSVLENTILLNKQISSQNSELYELQKHKEEMINMIVHDLKNPLNVVLGLAENELVYESGKRMMNLVMNILDVYKQTEVKFNLDKKEHLLPDISKSAVKEVAFLAKQKNILIETEVCNSVVYVDEEIIKRVFINILNNAVKFTPYNGKISIKSEELIIEGNGHKKVKVSITDTGKGISEDEIHYVFKKFSHSMKNRVKDSFSTGIGLTFCKMAIEAHDGEIGAKSIEGEGAAFWFTLWGSAMNNADLKSDYKNKKDNVDFTLHEKEYFRKMLEELRGFEFYEAGGILKVLNKYALEKYPNLLAIAENIKSAVLSGNLVEYEKLLGDD